MRMLDLLNQIDAIVWGPWLLVLLVGTGVYLTMYAVDMTIGYIVVKKCLEKSGIEHDEDSEVKEIL